MYNKGMPRTYTALQKEVINRLAEIEQEDEDRCAGCGGEDCICCEYYLDRQKWVEPDELFADDEDNYGSERYERYDFVCDECGAGVWEWCDICNTCVDCCTCGKKEVEGGEEL